MRFPFSRLVFAPFLLALGVTLSCAKVPPTGAGTTPRLLRVTVTLRGDVDLVRRHYFVLINRTDLATDPGPVPVIDLPWGNGFAAASQPDAQGFVGFVRIDQSQLNSYGLYSTLIGGIVRNPTQVGVDGFTSLGPPDNIVPLQPGARSFSFQVDLNRLPYPEKPYVQLNFLATDNLPQGAEPSSKIWDALGNGSQTGSINRWITLPVNQNIQRSNSETFDEPTIDDPIDVRDHLGPLVNDPTLDIVDWQVQIQGS